MNIKALLTAMFLVAGTCIGGGMLALPIATGVGGFVPSLAMMTVCWFAMTMTALFLLEASLWMEEGAHVITITSTLLGPIGKWTAWILYLFICYASTVAYTAGGGLQIVNSLEYYLGWTLSKDMGCVLFLFGFGSIIYLGTQWVGRINTLLFTGMVIAYFCLVGGGQGEIKRELLSHKDWGYSLIAMPLLLTTFSFQTIIPSLTPFLKRHAQPLRIAIVGGTTLTFAIYAAWQWVILGVVPVEGKQGLAAALHHGNQPITQFLREHLAISWVAAIAEYFAFFAIVTSFLGITLGLSDFLFDGLKIDSKKGKNHLLVAVLIAAPTLLFATQFERAFMTAMDMSGGLGDSILNGIIPVLFIWKGRNLYSSHPFYLSKKGSVLLLFVGSIFVVSLGIELFSLFWGGEAPYEKYDIFEIHNFEEVIKEGS